MEVRNTHNEKLEVLIEGASLTKASRVVVFVHGLGTNLHERGLFDDIVKELSKSSHLSFVRFSWSGFGKSEGRQEDTTLAKIVDDLKSVLDYTLSGICSYTDVEVIAFSMGNIVASHLIANGDYQIKRFLLVNPVDFKSGAKSYEKWLHHNGAKLEGDVLVIPRTDGSTTRLNRAFWDTMDSMNYKENLEAVAKGYESIFIRATDDHIVDNSELKQTKFDRIIELPGDHGFHKPADRKKVLELFSSLYEPKTAIVDENNKVIGSRSKAMVKNEDIYRVASLWIYNSKGQILIAKRAGGKRNNPGKWMTVAVSGTVEPGETYEQNILKETNEEIGIDLTKHNFKLVYEDFVDLKHRFFLQVFAAKLDLPIEAFTIDKNETSEIRWIDKHELETLAQKTPEQLTPTAPKIISDLIELNLA